MTALTTEPTSKPSSASWQTYSDVARILQRQLCVGGSDCPLSEQAHQRGWLMTYGGERFVILYEQNVEADRLSRELGIRFPRKLADPDRAKVRLWLTKFRNDPMDREFPEQRELMRRIRRWARP
jgi:hypothetical protein